MMASDSSDSDIDEVQEARRVLVNASPDRYSRKKLEACAACASPLPKHWVEADERLPEHLVGGGLPEHLADEEGDLRGIDRGALVDFLEDFVSNGGSDQSAETRGVGSSLKRALESEGSSSNPMNNVRQGVAREVARRIAAFVGGGLCGDCHKVSRFWEKFFSCDVCFQHYCQECYEDEPLVCEDCGEVICEGDLIEYRCGRCDVLLYFTHGQCIVPDDQLYCNECYALVEADDLEVANQSAEEDEGGSGDEEE